MEDYPSDYVEHNLPLLLLFGVENSSLDEHLQSERKAPQSDGFVVKLGSAPLSGARCQEVLAEFRKADGYRLPWRATSSAGDPNASAFAIKTSGRSYMLPPRKAAPPSDPLGISPQSRSGNSSPVTWTLHSPLSPLSPGAALFSDGVMTEQWVRKHQQLVPCTLLSLFKMTSDSKLNTLNDNQLKSDINQVSSAIRSSGYKTRHVVLLISDDTFEESSGLDERLSSIRRATGLDSKNSLFFLPADTSGADLAAFIGSLLNLISPSCVDYYRDLTKHARRKRGRGSIPPPTVPPSKGVSQQLGPLGWNVRYDFKLGIFAEFRQEMEAAGRHYSSALEGLLNPEGLFETTANWSPRWNEARLLADMVSFRFIRTLLWNGSTTQAVQHWIKYRDRMKEILESHGKGSSHYGWEAWISRWAKLMAQLVQRADLPVFHVPPRLSSPTLVERIINIFAPPERAIPLGERLAPWQLLHHSGYWNNLAAKHASSRRDLAQQMAQDDRLSPAQSPAAQVARRHGTFDTYLCPEPHLENPLEGEQGFDHSADVCGKLRNASEDFIVRSQDRFAAHLKLQEARQFLQGNQLDSAFAILEQLWKDMRWRVERWWTLAFAILSDLHRCALSLGHESYVILTTWELLSHVFPSHQDGTNDLMHCLQPLRHAKHDRPKASVAFKSEDVVSFVSASFTFEKSESHVSDLTNCQLVLTSDAKPSALAVTFSQVDVTFDGSLGSITITHDSSATVPSQHTLYMDLTDFDVDVIASKLTFKASADLSLSPGQVKIFAFSLVLREAGDIRPQLASLQIESNDFELKYDTSLHTHNIMPSWWQDRPAGPKAKRLSLREENLIKILPKPPRMEISIRNKKEMYFTDERVVLEIELGNLEDEETEVTLEVRFLHRDGGRVAFKWLTDSEDMEAAGSASFGVQSPRDLPGHIIGNLAIDETRVESMVVTAPVLPSDCILELKVLYHLLSDLGTPISKTLTTDIAFVSPFEANYDFRPMVHPDPWPNYFRVSALEGLKQQAVERSEQAFGIIQRWRLAARVASFADEIVTIEGADVIMNSAQGGIKCTFTPTGDVGTAEISPQETHERLFCIDTQKIDLEDKRAASLDLTLLVRWRRPGTSDAADHGERAIQSSVVVPRLSIPSSEPRVLASALVSFDDVSIVHLSYTMENPSMHLLTFNLTMEASEEFAISGPKSKTINILPMTRQTVAYNLLPLVAGKWITPRLNVIDRYFNKTLKVLAGNGVKADKKDISIWIDTLDDD